MALTRIAKEHADLQRDPLETCSASPAEAGNPWQWFGHITSPSDTSYEQVCLTNRPQEHDVSSSAAKGCVQPTHNGKRIGGKKYGIDMSRPEFEEYKNLIRVEEKNKFLIENADIVWDE
ncbi:Ubiquitin-conjugating enzyme E2 [Pyrenophora tritici-repentis]|nr:Ubiquitin-conjugating enzyme E2 [Pyrenophora tritici-repentis]KAI2479991.1 Ubiquitin-conjugating enzyme E2 [Pyrenophora tritici-repentis]